MPDRAGCHAALRALGFAPTPFSYQYNRIGPEEPLAPAGTGNHCVMLSEGYLEFLVPVAETAIATQLRAAIGRYVGVHSLVFGTGDAEREYRRLQAAGFNPVPPIALQRPVDTPSGEATARFTVVRVAPGSMAEGRIQYCEHHTRELVWQTRWLEHPNTAVALSAAFVCVADALAAAERYARFTGAPVAMRSNVPVLSLARGRVEFYDRQSFADRFAIEAQQIPWIAGCELRCRDIDAARSFLGTSGIPIHELGDGAVAVAGPASIGGIFAFKAAPDA